MATFSNSELTDMVMAYGAASGNASQARRLYSERFPGRRVPNPRTFTNAVQHLRDFGKFNPNDHDRGRQRSGAVIEIEPEILDVVAEEPNISIRRLALRMGVSTFIVWRTLREQGLHPYHIQRVQALEPGDPPRRLAFCHWLRAILQQQPNFLNNVIFTDEAGFTRDGIFNSQNTHIWSDENPHAVRERRFQRQFSINVWAGVLGNQLIGPHILPNRLTGATYLDFLQNIFTDLLDDVPVERRRDMWFLHDGAPPHYARIVANWLNDNFTEKWIGRNGPVLWPPRSPDLNPCDFFLWGHMKQLVYATPVNTIDELRQRVNNVAEIIRQNPEMILRTQTSMARRIQACIDNNGHHFEQLL